MVSLKNVKWFFVLVDLKNGLALVKYDPSVTDPQAIAGT